MTFGVYFQGLLFADIRGLFFRVFCLIGSMLQHRALHKNRFLLACDRSRCLLLFFIWTLIILMAQSWISICYITLQPCPRTDIDNLAKHIKIPQMFEPFIRIWKRYLHHSLQFRGKPTSCATLAGYFFYVLKDFMNNPGGSSLPWYMSDLPEAFHQTLFDLQSLTMIFMENCGEDNFKLGVRITILHSTATTEKEYTLLKFALQQLHSTCPPAQRQAGHVLIQWLWEHHYDAFGHFEDKHEVQSFYHIRWSTSTSINKQMLCNICFMGCVTTEFFWHLCWVQTCQNKLSLFFHISSYSVHWRWLFNVRTRENEARSLLQESDISNSVSNWAELFQSMQEQGTALVQKNKLQLQENKKT